MVLGFLWATASLAAATYDYAGRHSKTGQRTNSWNSAASWTNGPQAFPNAPGDTARTPTNVPGNVTLNLNQDITLGTLNWSGHGLQLCPGTPQGKLSVHNGGQPALWRVYAEYWFWLDADLVLEDSLTLSNAVNYYTAEPVRLNGVMSGPGRLVLDWHGPADYPLFIGASSNAPPNTYSGGTRLIGHSTNGWKFEPRKNGAFGTGDVELNGYAKLILRDRGATDDYIADTAALRLETFQVTNRANVFLGTNVHEVVGSLYLDGVPQPAGTYGASGSGAAQTLDDFLSGPGMLTVATGPPNPGALRNLPPTQVTRGGATLRGEVLATNAAPTWVYLFWGNADGGCQAGAWAHCVSLGVRGPGIFSLPVSNAPMGQTRYYRSYLTNALGGKWADGSIRFGPPQVQNLLPFVQTNHVTLRATVLDTNGLPTQARVFWGTNDGGTEMTHWPHAASLGTVEEGLLTHRISGLWPHTRYFYRFYLTNAAGAGWANASTSFTAITPPAYGDITFCIGSDLHYGATHRGLVSDELCRQVIDNMNALAGQAYPAAAGGGIVGFPRGALLAGDLTENSSQAQWASLTNDWGLNGERRLLFPVYEGWGNHESSLVVPEGIKARNPLRSANLNISTNGYHYSWDWDFLHVVCLNLFPGNEPDLFGNDPKGSLQFLKDDLATRVGASRRPVILYHHYGPNLPAGWWSAQQQTNYYEAIKDYNVIAILSGHTHGRAFTNWCGIDTGTVGTIGKWIGNFMVARVTWTNLLLLERTISNTWGARFTKPIVVPGTLVVSNSVGATQVTPSSARLNGQLIVAHPFPVAVTIYWGPTDGGTNAAAWANAVQREIRTMEPFFTEITGLSEKTTYYYRCYASSAAGQTWAPVSAQFTTPTDFGAWLARRKIVLRGYNGQTTLTNFPVLIRMHTNQPGFDYRQFASAVGADLRFSDESGYELNYEIDEWNTNGSSYIWVRVPRLSGTNTTLWAYWKNPAAATAPPAYTTNGATWSEGYLGVWHLKESNAVNSVTGQPGVGHGNTPTQGLVGGAQSFSRATGHQYIAVGSLNVTNLTLEAWALAPLPVPVGGQRVVEKPNSYLWEQLDPENTLKLTIFNPPDSYEFGQGGGVLGPEPVWTYWALSYDSTTAMAKGYRDGMCHYTQARSARLVPAQNPNPTTLSSPHAGYVGLLDEVRLSGVVRSADWLAACYATGANPESFAHQEAVLLNTPPVLSPIPNQTVNVGSILTVTATATDAESPPQRLTFSLLSAPPQATLNPLSGVFAWQPGVAHMGTTNTVVLKVTDDGIPPRSSTQSFRVVVLPPSRPILEDLGLTNGAWTMGVWGPAGRPYTIQASTNLRDWITLVVTNPPALPLYWADPQAGSFRMRFYRVLLGATLFPPAPVLSASRLTNGFWTFEISGPVDWRYRIQASTNLNDWTTLDEIVPTEMPYRWTDPQAASAAARFYRVRLGPE